MTSPRKPLAPSNVPVLFRLPNLHTRDAARPLAGEHRRSGPLPSPTDGTAVGSQVATARAPAVEPLATEAAVRTPPAAQSRPMAPSGSHQRAVELLHRHGITLAVMVTIACGSWLAGRHLPGRPVPAGSAETNLATNTAAPAPAAASPSPSAAQVLLAASAQAQREPAEEAAGPVTAAADPNAAADESDDFYQPEDPLEPAAANPAEVAEAESESPADAATGAEPAADEAPAAAAEAAAVVAQMPSGGLNPPANQPQAAAETPAADAAAPSEAAAEAAAPAEAAAAEAAPPAEAAAESQPPAAEAAQPEPEPEPKRRHILSRTPYGVPDWSRYFAPSGSVRAVSAQGGEPAASPPSANQPAFYLDNE